MKFEPRMQIAYVPTHVMEIGEFPSMDSAARANADDVEFGFVTSVRDSLVEPGTRIVFCRFWARNGFRLRTTANSEGCDPTNLVAFKYTEDKVVNALIAEYEMIVDPTEEEL